MYINFWYPICKSDELSNEEPLQSKLLGMSYVAFRDSDGAPHVLADTCVHRGGSLSMGKVIDDCVACPYHGWRFGGDGKCKLVPLLGPDVSPPARAKVDSYPVEERYGIVFAFLGDLSEEERPPLYEIEEYNDPAWREHEMIILEVGCYYQRSMENGVDPVHNEFVHPAQGFPPMHKDTFRIRDEDWGVRFDAEFGDPVLDNTTFAKDRNVTGELKAGSWHHGPNVLITSIFVNAASNMVQYFFEAPIDESHTKIYFINMRNFVLDPEMDEKVMEVNLRITSEDIVVLENLYPVRTPDTPTHELITASDEMIMKYRGWLRSWEQKGWRMDWKALKDGEGDVAYVIPSPARRNAGNWVLPAVPMVSVDS